MSGSLNNAETLFSKVKTKDESTGKKELVGSKRSKAKYIWEDVVAVLEKDLNARKEDLEVLKPTLIVNGGASKALFNRLIDHMGPIKREGQAKPGEFTISSIANLYRKECFHGFLSGGLAQSKLSNLPKGAWLARFSTQSPKCIAISMLSEENSVEHWVVPFDEEKNAYIFEDHEFPTFDAFLEHYKTHVLQGADSPLLDENTAPCLEGKIEIGIELGGGAFGKVYQAIWHRSNGTDLDVAAKKLTNVPPSAEKPEDDEDELEEKPICLPPDIEAESNILKNMRHPNVVSFFGMVFVNEVPLIITDLMKGGSLLGFLKNKSKREVTPKDLVRMLKEAAKGMDYLSTHLIVHRDLAARNLLVSDDTPNATVKVTDFGLSRKIGGAYYVKTGASSDPVLWAAPESFKPQPGKDNPFKGRVSTRSDRWSFGVILNEVFQFGIEPYSGYSKAEIRSYMSERQPVIKFLKVEDAAKGINKLIKLCTNYDSHQRPDFKQLAEALETIENRLAADKALNAWNKIDEAPIAEARANSHYDEEDAEENAAVAITHSAYDAEEDKDEIYEESAL